MSAITVATPTDRDRVTTMLVAAFSQDPVLRYLFPEQATYPRYAAAFFGHLFDKRVQLGTVWIAEQSASVAIWQPPSPAPADPDAAGPVVPRPGGPLAAELPAEAMARVDAYDEAVHAALPTGRFWYLGVLGTDPRHTGRGLGRAVMQAGLHRAAEEGLPAFLETSNPANVELYHRAGWEVFRQVAAPLQIWIMRHPGRLADRQVSGSVPGRRREHGEQHDAGLGGVDTVPQPGR